jgi:hypothetical protein
MRRALLICLLACGAARGQDAGALYAVLARESNPDVLSGLVAWWKFDGNTVDSVGTNNGVAIGATATNGLIGGAYNFRGGNGGDYVRTTFGSLKSNYLSFGAWVYPRAKVAYGKVICLGYRVDGSWSPPYSCFSLESSDAATGNPVSRISVSGKYYPSIGGGNTGVKLALDAWTFLMATYDGANAKVYQNGVLRKTIPVVGVIDYGTSKDLSIGTDSPYYNKENFNGLIDDVRIYNRALTSNEVMRIYNLYK